MQEFTERRAYTRIQLRAYACDKTCLLVIKGRHVTACLVDLSAGGARLRLPEAVELPRGQELAFSLNKASDGGLLQNLNATVRWQSEKDIGIQFDTVLEVGVSTLQNLIA